MKGAYAEMVTVLKEVRFELERSEESMWAALNPQEVIAILTKEIESLETTQRFANMKVLTSLFLPTAEIQEISVASGWSERYLALSTRFDSALERYH